MYVLRQAMPHVALNCRHCACTSGDASSRRGFSAWRSGAPPWTKKEYCHTNASTITIYVYVQYVYVCRRVNVSLKSLPHPSFERCQATPLGLGLHSLVNLVLLTTVPDDNVSAMSLRYGRDLNLTLHANVCIHLYGSTPLCTHSLSMTRRC